MLFAIAIFVIIAVISVWAWSRPPAKPGEKRIMEHWLPNSGSGSGTYHQPSDRDKEENTKGK